MKILPLAMDDIGMLDKFLSTHQMLTKVLRLCEYKRELMGKAAEYQSDRRTSSVPVKGLHEAVEIVTRERVTRTPDVNVPLEVGRCRLPVSKPELIARLVSYQRLKLRCHVPLSIVAFNINLRRYIEDALLQSEEYVPVDIELYLPMPTEKFASMKRNRFVHEIAFAGFAVEIFVHRPGGNIGNSHWAWRIPDFDRDTQRSVDVSRALEHDLPTYHTWRMKNTLTEFFASLPLNVPKVVIRLAWDFIFPNSGAAGDNAKVKEIDERVRLIMSLEQHDLLLDLRALNGEMEDPAYDAFWRVLGAWLEEVTDGSCPERRHGDGGEGEAETEGFMPFAMSTRDMIAQVVLRSRRGTSTTTASW
jgi:hypothetical protein